MRLVRLIDNTEGTVGISNLASLHQKRICKIYFGSQFVHVQDSPVLDMDFVSDSVFEFDPVIRGQEPTRSVFQRLKVSPNIALLAVMKR